MSLIYIGSTLSREFSSFLLFAWWSPLLFLVRIFRESTLRTDLPPHRPTSFWPSVRLSQCSLPACPLLPASPAWFRQHVASPHCGRQVAAAAVLPSRRSAAIRRSSGATNRIAPTSRAHVTDSRALDQKGAWFRRIEICGS
jgi:hypothetical protein